MPRAKKQPPPLPELTSADAFLRLAPFPAGGHFGDAGAEPFFLMSCLTVEEVGPLDPQKDRHRVSSAPVLSDSAAFALAVFWLPGDAAREMRAGSSSILATAGPKALRFRQSKAIFQQPELRRDETGLGLLSAPSHGDHPFERHFPAASTPGASRAPLGAWLRPVIRVQRAPTPAQTLALARGICALTLASFDSTPFVLLASEAQTPRALSFGALSAFARSFDRDDPADAWLSQAIAGAGALREGRALAEAAFLGAQNTQNAIFAAAAPVGEGGLDAGRISDSAPRAAPARRL